MATLEDVRAHNETIKKELTDMKTSLAKKIGDLVTGHSTVLDTIVAGQADVLATVKSTKDELNAAADLAHPGSPT